MKKLLTVVGMSMSVWAACAATGDWVRLADAPEPGGNLAFSAAWDPGRGLHLKVTDAATNRTALFDAGRERLSVPATNTLPLVLKFRQESWSLFSQDRCLASIPAPFPLPAVAWQPAAELPPEGARKTGFQKAADFRFEDSFMRPEGAENSLGEWNVESGAWALHTATETALDGAFLKPDAKRKLQSDFSPNFYSLSGKGTPAVISAGYDFYDNYSIEAGVRAEPGEMGLLFHYQDSGACKAFTVTMEEGSDAARLTLWSATSTNALSRRILGAVTTTLAPGQWVKLRVKIFEGRVQCFIDQAKALDVRMELPVGGRFGLYANSLEEARFDDVIVEANHDLDFQTVEDVRRSTVLEQGAFYPRARLFGLLPPLSNAPALVPGVSRQPQWLIVGSPAHGPHVFAAEFDRLSVPSCVGVLAGWTGGDQPYYRFTCRRTRKTETFLLECVTTNTSTVLEELVLPRTPGHAADGRVNLLFDATGGQAWRMYRNGELVLVRAPAAEARGASGLYVGPGTRTAIAIPTYAFKRADLYQNRYEKNNRFSEDPFMRLWASPEGQWVEERNKLVWYTGDFFGRFSLRMPCVEPSEIHLGVGEGATNGDWVVSVHDGTISLQRGWGAYTNQSPLAQAPTNGMASDGTGTWYTVQCEGRWLWVTSGDKTLFKQSLDRPMTGRRIRVAGFTTDQLKETYVERFNVKDFLFTESLFDWVVNGGRWEIVNRFQCDPRWSHMNGEGTNGLAALWAKYEIKGDFCVEMFAGQRMGWYERCGDLNMTVMAPEASPSQGYTITCTGWDPDSSQLYTTLYRNGAVMARSSQYLAPRKREGNKRLGYEPLIAPGRDVHGAWYYMKFRRIGHTLEYYFDNDLVFSVTDDKPLPGGMAGIWTYMNSMMVARVKVAAEDIRPREAAFASVPISSPTPPAAPVPGVGGLLKDGKPLSLCQPGFWEADDPVGRLRLEWHDEPGFGPAFTARNLAGSGNMFAACSLPPVPFPDLAGWRFDVKRSSRAQFNFHYSVGRIAGNGVYVPERRFFHRLSGSDLEKGGISQSGETPISPLPSRWTTVTAWLPEDLVPNRADRTLMVKVEGFGNLQPSLVQQGLSGNSPGEAYTVRDFTEITYSTPALALATNLPPPTSFAVIDPVSRNALASFGSVTGLQAWVNAHPTNGLTRVGVRTEGTNAQSAASLAWIQLPAQPAVTCFWHPRRPDAVALRCLAPYPDRRFLAADIGIGGVNPILYAEGFDTRTALVPRKPEFCGVPVSVTLRGSDVSNAFTLAWKDNAVRDVPVLLAFTGSTPFLENGEPRDRQAGLAGANPNRVRLASFDPRQGSYFEAMNTRDEKRLRCVVPASPSLARFPLFQFSYRTTDEMARVSFQLGNGRIARISESNAAACAVRYSTNLMADGAWHDWLGQVSDVVTNMAYYQAMFHVNSAELASLHAVDQTGLFSQWDLDDLVFGPAVSTAGQLAFTPRYFDFGGIESVRMAIRAGGAGSFATLSPAEAAALSWREITNDVETLPCLDGLTDGPHHLLVKARGRSGKESQVTDIPFLLDRKPSPASADFGSTAADPRDNAEMRVTWLSDGGAPSVDPESLRIKWQDTDISGTTPDMRLIRQADRDTLSFNWAWYFREPLSKTSNGQKANLVLTGMQDGAGNRSPDLVAPVTIDYAKDRVPPSLYHTTYPTNVFWFASWEAAAEKTVYVTAVPAVPMEVIQATNEPPYLRVNAGNKAVLTAVIAKPNWVVKDYPNVALRIRRPLLAATNILQLAVEFTTTTNTVVVALTPKLAASRNYTLPNPIVWRSNEWASVFLNLEAVVKDQIPTQSMAGLTVKGLSIIQTSTAPADPFHLQSVFVYAPGAPIDQVKLNAYDISGMDRPIVGYENAAGQPVGAPSMPGWVVFQAKDKAGNLTMPLRVPAWGPTAQTGGH